MNFQVSTALKFSCNQGRESVLICSSRVYWLDIAAISTINCIYICSANYKMCITLNNGQIIKKFVIATNEWAFPHYFLHSKHVCTNKAEKKEVTPTHQPLVNYRLSFSKNYYVHKINPEDANKL